MVERGIATLAVMGQTWEDSRPEVSDSESNDLQEKWAADQAAIGRAFAALLQQVWLAPLSTQVSLMTWLKLTLGVLFWRKSQLESLNGFLETIPVMISLMRWNLFYLKFLKCFTVAVTIKCPDCMHF